MARTAFAAISPGFVTPDLKLPKILKHENCPYFKMHFNCFTPELSDCNSGVKQL